MVVQNPNNWHWVDKNCIEWSRDYFRSKLIDLKTTQDSQSVWIKSLKSLEGDVEVCQRKGKVISLFDLKMTLGFEASDDITGNIVIPEIAYDSEIDDYQFDISFTSKSSDSVKSLIRNKLIPELRKSLSQFGIDLIKVHGSDIQIDSELSNSKLTKENQKDSTINTVQNTKVVEKTVISNSKKNDSSKIEESNSKSSSSNIPKYNTSTLHLSPVFNTSAEQLYLTLLQPERVRIWSRSEPKIEPREGFEYSLFNDSISGKILKLIPNEKIIMSWRLKDWKLGHFANLTIDLIQSYSETKMDVLFEGIPIGQEEAVEDNFDSYYIKSIKIAFGFGAVL